MHAISRADSLSDLFEFPATSPTNQLESCLEHSEAAHVWSAKGFMDENDDEKKLPISETNNNLLLETAYQEEMI